MEGVASPMGCEKCGSHVQSHQGRGRPRRFCLMCRPPSHTASAYKPRARTSVQASCRLCNKVFDTTTHGKRAYCSSECKAQAIRARNYAVSLVRGARPAIVCANPKCGVEFLPEVGLRQVAHCSPACRMQRKRSQQSGSTYSRRARKYGVRYEHVNRLAVFEEDGWRCYLCGEATPRELMGTTHDLAPELEHVVPLSLGGAHARSNVRCACRRCNLNKGAKVPGGRGRCRVPLRWTPAAPSFARKFWVQG